MTDVSQPYEFDYDTGAILYGRGCIKKIGERLAAYGLERALIVCGSNVGANRELMEPVIDGLGDTFAGVFDETTPAKHIRTAYDGARRIREDDIDVLVPIGGGSSLDVSKVMSVFAADDRPYEALIEPVAETGVVPTPDDSVSLVPSVVVPTTLAGADMANGGGIKLTSEPVGEPPLDGEVRAAGVYDPRLAPLALFYDPELFETTPQSVLVGSAMNGFDKGLETLYSGTPTSITDATAIHGLRTLRPSLPALADADRADGVLDRVIDGIILVQYGRQTSIIHAFGHGLSFYYPVQQGEAHAVFAPHALRYVFEHVDGRRERIAEGLGIDTGALSDDELADEIVEHVAAVRDSLGLPSRIRDLDGVERDHLPALAAATHADSTLRRAPVDPSVEDVESIYENAW